MDGDIIIHVTDLTTRKLFGTFQPSGLHMNRDKYLPSITLEVSSETMKNIAKGGNKHI